MNFSDVQIKNCIRQRMVERTILYVKESRKLLIEREDYYGRISNRKYN